MGKKVGIVSYGVMKYKGPNEVGMWNDEATYAVSKQALDRVGLRRKDLDAVFVSTMDGLDGITISAGLLVPAAGAYKKESIRIETSGLHCLRSALVTILAGEADLAIVASSDTVEFDFGYITNCNQDPFFRGPLGFNAVQSFGFMSMNYLRRTDATEDDFAMVAAKNYQCGAANELVHVARPYTKEEVLASPLVCSPLRELEISGFSNGAVAIILASEERARELTDNPIWIDGFGASANVYNGSWAELSGQTALRKAAQKAYQMAGIKNPREEIDFVEMANPFSPFELMGCEALGLCEAGAGPSLLRDGVTFPDGDLPVNLSGGSLCTNGPNSSGIFRIVQAIIQFNGTGRAAKKRNPARGLIHDSDLTIGAVGGDSHAVLILGKEV